MTSQQTHRYSAAQVARAWYRVARRARRKDGGYMMRLPRRAYHPPAGGRGDGLVAAAGNCPGIMPREAPALRLGCGLRRSGPRCSPRATSSGGTPAGLLEGARRAGAGHAPLTGCTPPARITDRAEVRYGQRLLADVDAQGEPIFAPSQKEMAARSAALHELIASARL
jgi:hypothetical protein